MGAVGSLRGWGACTSFKRRAYVAALCATETTEARGGCLLAEPGGAVGRAVGGAGHRQHRPHCALLARAWTDGGRGTDLRRRLIPHVTCEKKKKAERDLKLMANGKWGNCETRLTLALH